jgi:hypothetical protein
MSLSIIKCLGDSVSSSKNEIMIFQNVVDGEYCDCCKNIVKDVPIISIRGLCNGESDHINVCRLCLHDMIKTFDEYFKSGFGRR